MRSISKRSSSKFSAGCGGVLIGLFLLIFVVVGVGVMYFVSGVPLMKVVTARSWQPAQCEVTFSQVVQNRDSDGGHTSRIDIQYRYTWNDHVYTGKRYDFTVGSDNVNDAWKQSVVDAHKPGTTVPCFVDANDPTQSVINREMRWGYLAGFAFGAPFALAPLLIGYFMFAVNRRMRQRQAMMVPLSTGAAATTQFVNVGAAPSSTATYTSASTPTFTSGEPVVLKPEMSRLGKLIGMTVICLFWNGIVGVFTYFELTSGLSKTGGDGWFLRLFLIPFQIIGLLLIYAVGYTLLGLLNPKPTLTLSAASVPIGGSLTLQWKMSRNAGRLKNLKILLSGREEARYRRGTDTHTDKSTFYEAPIIDTSDTMRMQQGMATVTIPANTMHSFESDDNKIIWSLQVKGEIGMWPDVDDTYDILVRPQ
jgi:hypothetical protein